MIGNEINCLKNIGLVQLNKATAYCRSLDSSQILPRNEQESYDFISALLSLDIVSESGEIVVSIGIYKTKEGEWYDSADQPISYFNWLPDEPDNFGGNQNFAGFRIDKVNHTSRWTDYSDSKELNVVCTKTAGHGKNDSLSSKD